MVSSISWKNLNLSVKFTLIFGVALALLFIAVAMYKVSADRTATGYKELIDSEMRITQLSTEVTAALAGCRRDEMRFLASGDKQAVASFNNHLAHMSEKIARISALSSGHFLEIYSLAQQIDTLQTEYKDLFGQVVKSALTIGFDEKSGLRGKFNVAADELEGKAKKYEMSDLFFAVLDLVHDANLYFNIQTPNHRQKVGEQIKNTNSILKSRSMEKEAREAIGFRLEEYTKWIEQSYDGDSSLIDIIKDQIGGYEKALMDEIETFYVPQARVDILEIRRAEKNYLASRSLEDAETTRKMIKRLVEIFSNSSIPVQKKDEISTFISTYRAHFDSFVEESNHIDQHREKMFGIVNKIEPAVQKIAGLAAELAQQKEAATQNEISQLNRAALIVTIVVILLVSVFLFITVRAITQPLKKSIAVAEAMSAGDLTGSIDIDRQDEVGILAASLNNMIHHLRELLGKIVTDTGNLNDSSVGLIAISEKMQASTENTGGKTIALSRAAENMSSNMLTVASASEQASTNLNVIASAVEEMESTIKEIARNSTKASEIVENAVRQGDEASARMEELGSAAVDITKVAETITEISEQTNLLALNATIEAARAGQAGKGFAVVADEIKQLATQTANATQDIKNKIAGVQESSRRTSKGLVDIIQIIHEVNDIAKFVASAVDQQSEATREIVENISQASRGINEINQSINVNAEVAQSVTAEVSDIRKESGDLSAISRQVHTSADSLVEIGGCLQDLVKRFVL